MLRSNIKFPIPFNYAFANGALFKSVVPARDWGGSGFGAQAVDEQTGLPLFLLTVEDQDPLAVEWRRERVRVKLAAHEQPEPPAAPFPADPNYRPVELVDLVVTPWVDRSRCPAEDKNNDKNRCRARLAWSMRASGLITPQSAAAARAS